MFRRIPQPPVNPALRDLERHGFWPGFVVALIGAALAFCGARHLTAVETANGGTAWETQLIKAYSSSGLQFPDQIAPPPPPKLDGSVAGDQAFARWAKQTATGPTWKVRVDTSAKAACPT